MFFCLCGCRKEYTPKYDVNSGKLDDYLISTITEQAAVSVRISNDIGVSLDYSRKEYEGGKFKALFRKYNEVVIDDDHYCVVNVTLYNDYPNEKYLDDFTCQIFDRKKADESETIEVNGKKLSIVPNLYKQIKHTHNGSSVIYENSDEFVCLWIEEADRVEFIAE